MATKKETVKKDVAKQPTKKKADEAVKQSACTLSTLTTDIATEVNLTKADVDAVLRSFIKNVSKAASEGKRVEVGVRSGVLFSGERVSRAARKGRNPQTGATIDIPAKDVYVLHAGSKITTIHEGM